MRPMLIYGTTSDHAGLHIQLTTTEKETTPFKFFNSWLRNDKFNELFAEAWNKIMEGSPIYILQRKIEAVRKAGNDWTRQKRSETETPVKIVADLQTEASKLQGDPHNPCCKKGAKF